MKDSNRKLVYLLWVVITVLIIGAGIGGFILMHKADELTQTNEELTSNNTNLRNQLQEVRKSPSPSPSVSPKPSPSVSPSPSASPSVSPSTSPSPSPSPSTSSKL